MKRLLKLSTAIAAALMISATAYAEHADSPKQTINIGASQHIVKIALPANATTGYQWYVSNYDANLLTLTGYHYIAPTTRRVGAGGTAEFLFAVKPGFHVAPQITNVSFVYGQSWDMNGATGRTIILTSIPTYSNENGSAAHVSKKMSHESKKASHRSQPSSNSSVNTLPSSAQMSASEPVQSSDMTPAPTSPSPSTSQPVPASDSTSTNAAQSWLTIPSQS